MIFKQYLQKAKSVFHSQKLIENEFSVLTVNEVASDETFLQAKPDKLVRVVSEK